MRIIVVVVIIVVVYLSFSSQYEGLGLSHGQGWWVRVRVGGSCTTTSPSSHIQPGPLTCLMKQLSGGWVSLGLTPALRPSESVVLLMSV